MNFEQFLIESEEKDIVQVAKKGGTLDTSLQYKGVNVVDLLFKNSANQKQPTLQDEAKELITARVKDTKSVNKPSYYFDPKQEWFYVILRVENKEGDVSFAAVRGQLNSSKKWTAIFIKNYEVNSYTAALSELEKTNGKLKPVQH